MGNKEHLTVQVMISMMTMISIVAEVGAKAARELKYTAAATLFHPQPPISSTAPYFIHSHVLWRKRSMREL